MTLSVRASLCWSCSHFHSGVGTCDAFPESVPDEIFYGGDHTSAVPGDHGIQYEMAPGPEAKRLFVEWRDFKLS